MLASAEGITSELFIVTVTVPVTILAIPVPTKDPAIKDPFAEGITGLALPKTLARLLRLTVKETEDMSLLAFAEKPKALVLVCIVTAGDIVLAKPVELKEPAVKEVKTVLIKALANTLPVLLKGLSEKDVNPNTA